MNQSLVHRSASRYTVWLFVVWSAIMGLACSRQGVLKTTLASLNTARDGFTAWDAEHQKNIVAKAGSMAEGRMLLDAYRLQRDKVIFSFEIAYRSLSVASLEGDEASIGRALQAAKDIFDLIEALRGKAPAPPPPAGKIKPPPDPNPYQ